MVNYNDTNTIATPSIDINRVQILERRFDVIKALKKYENYRNSGAGGSTTEFKTNLSALFWELQETLMRKFHNNKDLSYEQMENILFPESGMPIFKECIKVWKAINIMLGEINLTRVDTGKRIHTPREFAIRYNNEKEE